MRLNDHPPPHFHVFYGEYSGSVQIGSPKVMKGPLPNRVQRIIEKWAERRESELRDAWQQIANGETPDQIDPID